MALTDEQKEEFFSAIEAFYFQQDDSKVEVLFRLIDKNGDGKIDRSELESLLTQMAGQKIPEDVVTTKLNEADANQDGSISIQEFLDVLKKDRES